MTFITCNNITCHLVELFILSGLHNHDRWLLALKHAKVHVAVQNTAFIVLQCGVLNKLTDGQWVLVKLYQVNFLY